MIELRGRRRRGLRGADLGGMHFRFALRDTRTNAELIAAYVLEHAAEPLRGAHVGQLVR